MKKKILKLIEKQRAEYERLAQTRNGFEMACQGGVQACKDITKQIEEL